MNEDIASKSNSTIGIKEYELSDHLGNVDVVILDRKYYSDYFFLPAFRSLTDYYPFGYPLPTRSYSTGYRYGFNGQEGDGEIYGDKKCYSYEFRNYDSRIGRWWSIDELNKQYPWISSYTFVENDVVRKKDIGGKYGSDGHYWTVYAMGLMIGLTNDEAIKWAIAAEYYDNTVIMSSSIQNTIFIDKLTWLPGPLQYLHGLTGGSSSLLKSATKKQILGGNINDSHTFGDAYAHATKSSNYTILYSPPWGHAGSNEDPDNIGKHPEQYLSYVNDFVSILKTMTGKTGTIDFAVYEEVSKSQSIEVRTGILQSYIASKNGQQLIVPYSIELEKSLKNLNIKYSITTKTEEIVSSLKYGETYTITKKTITINEKK
jgi:RHS repeat-associated protein